MSGENDYVTETVDFGSDSKSKNMITTSDCNTQLLEITTQHAQNNKKTLDSAMDSVMSLMKEVMCRENEAEEAVENIGTSSSDILAKVEELKQLQISSNQNNQTRAKEVYAERDVLTAEMDALQFSVVGLLDTGNASIADLHEIRKALEIRLISALTKEEAEQEKQNVQFSAEKALADEEIQMEKVEQESERLKMEAAKNSEMRELLTHHGDEVNTLRKAITCKWQDVNKLKETHHHAIVLSDI